MYFLAVVELVELSSSDLPLTMLQVVVLSNGVTQLLNYWGWGTFVLTLWVIAWSVKTRELRVHDLDKEIINCSTRSRSLINLSGDDYIILKFHFRHTREWFWRESKRVDIICHPLNWMIVCSILLHRHTALSFNVQFCNKVDGGDSLFWQPDR